MRGWDGVDMRAAAECCCASCQTACQNVEGALGLGHCTDKSGGAAHTDRVNIGYDGDVRGGGRFVCAAVPTVRLPVRTYEGRLVYVTVWTQYKQHQGWR